MPLEDEEDEGFALIAADAFSPPDNEEKCDEEECGPAPLVHDFGRIFIPPHREARCILCHITRSTQTGREHNAAKQLVARMTHDAGVMSEHDLAQSVLEFYNKNVLPVIDEECDFRVIDINTVKVHLSMHASDPKTHLRQSVQLLNTMIHVNNENGVFTLDEHGNTVLNKENSILQLRMMKALGVLTSKLI